MSHHEPHYNQPPPPPTPQQRMAATPSSPTPQPTPPPAGTPRNYLDPNQWNRLHWLAPVGQSLSFALWMTLGLGYGVLKNLGDSKSGTIIPFIIGFLVLAIILFAVFTYFRWRVRLVNISTEGIRDNSGLFFKTRRHMRIDRIQSLDITQPLVARIFGLAKLAIRSADDGDGAIDLAYIKYDEAQQIRQHVLTMASGANQHTQYPLPATAQPQTTTVGHDAGPVDQPDVPAPQPNYQQQPSALADGPAGEGRQMLQVPTGRLVGVSLLNVIETLLWSILVLVIVAIILGVVLEEGFVIALVIGLGVISPVIGVIISTASSFMRDYGFTVSETSSGLRLKYGLLEKKTRTIPPGRVQAVEVRQRFLWRMTKWYRVRVTVAGLGGEADDDISVVLPAGSFEDVLRVLAVISPNPAIPDAADMLKAGVDGKDSDQWFTTSPTAMKWLDPLAYRRNGYAHTPTLLLMRGGRLARRLTIMEHARIQEAEINQGPLQRRFNVATLSFDVPSGPVNTTVKHVGWDNVVKLFDHEAHIAAHSRRLSDRNQWMRPDELGSFEREAAQAKAKLDNAPSAPQY